MLLLLLLMMLLVGLGSRGRGGRRRGGRNGLIPRGVGHGRATASTPTTRGAGSTHRVPVRNGHGHDDATATTVRVVVRFFLSLHRPPRSAPILLVSHRCRSLLRLLASLSLSPLPSTTTATTINDDLGPTVHQLP